MEKKILTIQKQPDGRFLVLSDSYPVEYTPEVIDDIKNHSETMVAVPVDFEFPETISGKKRNVYWNFEKEIIEVEYIDKTFDEMDAYEQNAVLLARNNALQEELELTQAALFELHAMIAGGNKDGSN